MRVATIASPPFEGEDLSGDPSEQPAVVADETGAAGEIEDVALKATGGAALGSEGAVEFDPRTGRGIFANCVYHSLPFRLSPPDQLT